GRSSPASWSNLPRCGRERTSVPCPVQTRAPQLRAVIGLVFAPGFSPQTGQPDNALLLRLFVLPTQLLRQQRLFSGSRPQPAPALSLNSPIASATPRTRCFLPYRLRRAPDACRPRRTRL